MNYIFILFASASIGLLAFFLLVSKGSLSGRNGNPLPWISTMLFCLLLAQLQHQTFRICSPCSGLCLCRPGSHAALRQMAQIVAVASLSGYRSQHLSCENSFFPSKSVCLRHSQALGQFRELSNTPTFSGSKWLIIPLLTGIFLQWGNFPGIKISVQTEHEVLAKKGRLTPFSKVVLYHAWSIHTHSQRPLHSAKRQDLYEEFFLQSEWVVFLFFPPCFSLGKGCQQKAMN